MKRKYWIPLIVGSGAYFFTLFMANMGIITLNSICAMIGCGLFLSLFYFIPNEDKIQN